MASTYTVTIEEAKYTILPISDHQIEVNGIRHDIDFAVLDDRSYSLILDGKTFVVERADPQTPAGHGSDGNGDLGHTTHISVKGNHFTARVDDEHSLLVGGLFTKPQLSSGTQVIRAPMPGLISRIEVVIDEVVNAGKGLLVLEAMKMENEIRSLRHGRVQSIHVERGKPVEKGEPLVTIVEL